MSTTGKRIYLIGSMKNRPRITGYAAALRREGFEVFDDWLAPGPEADDHWRDYERGRGHSFPQALKGHTARHIFEFDKRHLDSADIAVLVMPAGKSAHLELGYHIGRGKAGYILLEDDPERYDVMYGFASGVFLSFEELRAHLAPPCAHGVVAVLFTGVKQCMLCKKWLS